MNAFALTPRKGAQLFFVYVAVQAVAAFAVGMAGAVAFSAANPDRGPGFGEAMLRAIVVPTVAGSILLGGIAIFMLVRKWLREPDGRADLSYIGLVRPRAFHISMSVLTGIVLGFVHAYVVMGVFAPPDAVRGSAFLEAWRAGGGARVMLVLLTLLVAPVVEEFVFRGAIFAGFRSQWPAMHTGAMVTALFVAVHAVEASSYPASLISITLLGIATAAAREKTGSILPSTALHAAYNFVVIAVVYPALAR